MKTAPFDLAKALAGHPLITRDGRPATGFGRYPSKPAATPYFYYASVDGDDEVYTGEGHWSTSYDECDLDLFLAMPEVAVDAPDTPTLSIPGPIARHLADLTDTGLYGTTVEDTALLLLKERLRDIVNPSQL